MKAYTCDICLKIFKQSNNLTRHRRRKFPCKQAFIQNNPQTIPNNPQIIPNNPQIIPDDLNFVEQVTNNKKEATNCKYCNIQFKTLNGYYKHTNELRCHEMPVKEVNKIKLFKNNKIVKKKIETETQLSISSSITNNNIINNITNTNNGIINNINFKINPLGQEDLSFLTKEEKLRILHRKYMGVPELIKTIHDNPVNHNIFIPNINKSILAYVNKDNKVEYDNYDDICEQIIENNIQRFDKFFNELEKDLNATIKIRLKKVMEENNGGDFNDKYMSDIKYYLINITKQNKKDITDYLTNLEKKLELITI
jgi:hypothetical protein